jgi:hypothetical protein
MKPPLLSFFSNCQSGSWRTARRTPTPIRPLQIDTAGFERNPRGVNPRLLLAALRTALGFLLLCMLLPATSGELEERDQITENARLLFRGEDFADIEAMADDFRAHNSRTSSGLWKIGLLHDGLDDDWLRKNKDEKYWAGIAASVAKWIDAFPSSPTPRILYANVLSAHAWAIRGGGWARDVREEDWKPFHELIAQARAYLLANKEIGTADPQWYESMIELARVDGSTSDDVDALVYEATWKYPNYYPNYFATIMYLQPRWHGDLAAIDEFANRAVRATREIEGESMYARIYWYVSQLEFGERVFEDTSVTWPKMKRGIVDVLKRYPDQWNINNFAHFACLAGDRKLTAHLTARVTKSIREAWANDATLFARCRDWASGEDTSAPPPASKASE